MKRFFTQIAVFAGILLVLAVAFDWMISSGLKKTEGGNFYTLNALMNDAIKADVVMYGNSRVEHGYDPCVIDSILGCNSFNFGVSGQPFGVSCLRWQLYNRHNNPPKLIIINCDYLELRGMAENGFKREQYYPYISESLLEPFFGDFGFSQVDKYIPLYRYHGEFQLIRLGLAEFFHIQHDKEENIYKGYIPFYEEYDGTNLEQFIRDNRLNFGIDKEVVSLLDSMLSTVDRDITNIVFVQAPYYRRMLDNMNDTNAIAVYDSLSKKYSIPVLDYSRIYICNDSTYFRDGCHVNFRGSAVFTRKMAHDIDSLGLYIRE